MIFEIDFASNQGLFQLESQYSAYPEEQEVLLQDGLEYLIKSNKTQVHSENDKEYRLIQLKYPPK